MERRFAFANILKVFYSNCFVDFMLHVSFNEVQDKNRYIKLNMDWLRDGKHTICMTLFEGYWANQHRGINNFRIIVTLM